MERRYFFIILISLFLFNGISSNAQKQVERLDRGAIVVKRGFQNTITWRLLGDEPYDTGFNIYRDSVKINDAPVTNTTSYFDQTTDEDCNYYVKAIIDSVEIENNKPARIFTNTESALSTYFDIPIERPARGENGGFYYPNDASTGDLNGDGELDIVLKWDPNNAKDNSQSGVTDDVILDGYTLDGEHLWRINLGPNVRAGAHYTQFLVFDFDGNGNAEVMVKTAPGTRDASGNYIKMGPAKDTDHTKKYRNNSGYVLSGPEFITVFDGETGNELATADYWPKRGSVGSWGDDYGNRLDRYNATVAYVDGEKPSAVFQRGYYTRLTMAAWNWRDGELSKAWTFDSKTADNKAYFGQGNHSIHVIDANNDGLHDIVTGSAVISGTGEGMHTTGMGHGDACHVTYMEKDNPRPMIYMCHESGGNGVSLRYADDGEIIFQHKKDKDVGRGCAGYLDPENPGFVFWASSGMGLYNQEGTDVGGIPNSVNFVIWWDGSLTRQLMNGNQINKWTISNNKSKNLLNAVGTSSNNGSKSTPTLQADLFGDWREELILRVDDHKALRVFTSTMPTTYKLPTLMHDPVYRCQVSSQNSSYNQPPHSGYYIAPDMDFPTPNLSVNSITSEYIGSGNIIKNLSVNDSENAEDWLISSEISEATSIFGNEEYYLSSVSEYFDQAECIQTSISSNTWDKDETIASFYVNEHAIVAVMIDVNATEIPEWLSTYTLKDETIIINSPNNDVSEMAVYEKAFYIGDQVKLGTIGAANTMYFVTAKINQNTAAKQLIHNPTNLKVYPNPFNQQLQIDYELTKKQDISIELYDFSGKLVHEIEKGIKKSGVHTAQLDGSNYTPGVFFLKFVSSENIQQEKILLIR